MIDLEWLIPVLWSIATVGLFRLSIGFFYFIKKNKSKNDESNNIHTFFTATISTTVIGFLIGSFFYLCVRFLDWIGYGSYN
ncbi:hypothetical protein A3C23_04010 [Candidatus Roizmanbacteria bacterium RIFCSPHIGHO2_02_FULL_37_13b]|uniref:Uncharacterized protein n=1 Tax=Candidatus Roizmanbacteria bacterium RIFCSPLOWO2_02_FULL_36_11 TaxID=1802071 RepID=A0A1F7JH23_9BACT|nr:MAG: hypothetical protein A3C23_04010 [Candidatus Roizmanbacteria bacterium RIFCSPHIGHO2_02_FULL_37_13b]OGK54882.1 MAG: hypothetical protein A3H78_00160 [Candidatus Roizmanbacteria bacterium RIFCSPLOWO2_02_FULL_36_11]